MTEAGERRTIPQPAKDRRWDIDERGDGIGDARAQKGRIDQLGSHAGRPNWIAEEPDAHLWPHLEQAISAPESPWTDANHSIDAAGRLIVDLVHAPLDGDRARASLQADVLKLLGFVVESATFAEIEDERGDGALVVDVVTGMLDDQTPFKAHGHTLRFRVTTT